MPFLSSTLPLLPSLGIVSGLICKLNQCYSRFRSNFVITECQPIWITSFVLNTRSIYFRFVNFALLWSGFCLKECLLTASFRQKRVYHTQHKHTIWCELDTISVLLLFCHITTRGTRNETVLFLLLLAVGLADYWLFAVVQCSQTLDSLYSPTIPIATLQKIAQD